MPNFNLNWKFCFFGWNLPKKVASSLKEKSEHHHWILYSRNGLQPRTKYLEQNKDGTSKNGQDKKSLTSTFAAFFECYCESLISGWETGC